MVEVGAYFSCNEMIKKAKAALGVYSQFSQDQIDGVLKAVYLTILENRKYFSELTINESGFGNLVDKTVLCGLCVQSLYQKIKNTQTVGLSKDSNSISGVLINSNPIGVISCKVSTRFSLNSLISSILFSIKTRNPLIFASCAHSEDSVGKIIKVCYDSAVASGAPDDCLQFIGSCGNAEYEELLKNQQIAKHLDLDVDSFVFSYVGSSADLNLAASEIVKSKSFDNGLLICTEKILFLNSYVKNEFIDKLKSFHGFILSDESGNLFRSENLDKYIGLSASEISKKIGVSVPEDVKLLLIDISNNDSFINYNKFVHMPVLPFMTVNSIEDVAKIMSKFESNDSLGETLGSIFSNNENEILSFSSELEVNKLLVNVPSSLSISIGTYNSSAFSILIRDLFFNDLSFIELKDLLRTDIIAKRRLRQSYRDMDLSLYNDEVISARDLDEKFNLNT